MRSANSAVENARENVANLINAEPSEIVFTSGATESNNLAIKSIARYHLEKDYFSAFNPKGYSETSIPFLIIFFAKSLFSAG